MSEVRHATPMGSLTPSELRLLRDAAWERGDVKEWTAAVAALSIIAVPVRTPRTCTRFAPIRPSQASEVLT